MHSRQLTLFALALWALGCGSGTSLVPQDGSSGAIDSAAGGTGGGTGGTPTGTGGGTGGGGGGGGCGPVCAIYCPNGNVLDSSGCPTCSCKPPPVDAGGTNSVTLRDDACGTQVEVKVGTQVAVSLASTYWTIQGSSRPAVLQQSGPMTNGKGQNCPPFPGSGCGTANMSFSALSAGQAVVSASRTSCGEALLCGHGQGQDQCTITVVVVP